MWSYIRDTITIDAAFMAELKAEIAAKNLPLRSTLFFAAREIRHAPGFAFVLANYHVVMLAEDYYADGGSINLSGTAGTAGAVGATGTAGIAFASTRTPGGTGGTGGNGAPGVSGANFMMFVTRLHGGTFISDGGAGGAGGRGGAGGKGGSGKIVYFEDGTRITELIGTNGGNGGNGGNGSLGGRAGNISVFFAEKDANPLVQQANGGAAGAAGGGGPGGIGGPECSNGLPGKPGLAGARGSNVTVVARQFPEWGVWNTIREGFAPFGTYETAQAWAEYRIRVGDFYARSFAPTRDDTKPFLARAVQDFRFAFMWDPIGLPQAGLRLRALNSGMNPLGLRRDHYVIPSFPAYERAYLDYAPLVLPIVSDVQNVLLHTNSISQNQQMLDLRIANTRSQIAVIETERAEATLALTRAQSAVSAADAKLSEIDAEVTAKRAQLAEAQLQLPTQFIVTVAEAIGAVIAVVGAIYTGGASIMAFAGLVAAAQEKWGNLSIDQATGEVKYQDSYLVDWVDWKDASGKLDPKLKPEIKALGGGLEAVIKAGKTTVTATLDLIDKAKVLGDIGNATVDGQLENELKTLLKRSAEAAFAQAESKVSVEQAQLHAKVVELRAAQAQADLDGALVVRQSLSNDNLVLGRVARLLMRRAQEYMAYLSRFRFLAVRALDIYTLRDHSASLGFDIGFVHPDTEEHVYAAFERGDSSRALSLVQAYQTSWSRLPDIIALRQEYLDYAMAPELVTQPQSWSFAEASAPTGPVLQLVATVDAETAETSDAVPTEGPPIIFIPTEQAASLIAQFREHHAVSFDVRLDELYTNRFEAKVDTVAVALVGATAQDATINCILVHGGESVARRLDGSLARAAYPPLALPVAASKVDDGGGAPAGASEAFWGRSPAATWRLLVEPQVMSGSNVDLGGLTKIVVTIRYKAILGGVSVSSVPAAMAVLPAPSTEGVTA